MSFGKRCRSIPHQPELVQPFTSYACHVFFHGDVSRVSMEKTCSSQQMLSRVLRLAKSMLEQ